MLNQTVLVGRLTKDPQLYELENGKAKSYITLAVSRAYKNKDGVYDADFIRCTLWNNIAINTCEYCKKGDVVGVKGRLETDSYEKDGERKYTLSVIAEKVTFLSSRGKDDMDDFECEDVPEEYDQEGIDETDE